MKNNLIFILIFLLFVPLIINASESYFLDFEFIDSNNIKLNNLELVAGQAPQKYKGADYQVNLHDGKNKIIYSDNFNTPALYPMADLDFFDSKGNQIVIPALPFQDNITFSLILPYFENAEKIKIIKKAVSEATAKAAPAKTILDINIKDYINKEAVSFENEKNNSSSFVEKTDKKEINFSERMKAQALTPEEIDEIFKNNYFIIYLAAFLLLIILILFSIFIYRKIKK